MTPNISKTPPQSLEMEEAVLGALLLERDAYLETESVLSPEVFYADKHQLVYEAIQALSRRGDPVDTLTVSAELEAMGKLDSYCGGRYGVQQLTNRVSSAANILYHSHILFEFYLKRKAIALATETLKEAYSEYSDALDLVSQLSIKAEALADVSSVNDEIKDLSENLLAATQHIENTKQHGGVSGVPTGYSSLNKLTAGWQDEELVVIAAASGMGKSAFVLQLVLNAAEEASVPVALFSLEMSSMQLTKRMQSNYSEIPSDKIKINNLSSDDWGALNAANDKLSRYKIKIDDTPSLSVRALKSKCRKLKRQGRLGMIVVDYIQLVNGTEATGGKGGLREQEVAFISRSLKSLAKELKVPVLALSQLNRDVEKRGGKEPQLSDLRESAAIGQDADIVIFIHRPEYYGINEDSDGQSTAGLAQIIFAKYRDGAPARTKLRFIPSISKFVEWENEPVTVRSFIEPPEKDIIVGQNLIEFATEDVDPPF